MKTIHWHIHIYDAPAAFEKAKHPRGRHGHFQPGGGKEEAAPDPGHHALPVSTGVPKKRDKRRKRGTRDGCQCPKCTTDGVPNGR